MKKTTLLFLTGCLLICSGCPNSKTSPGSGGSEDSPVSEDSEHSPVTGGSEEILIDGENIPDSVDISRLIDDIKVTLLKENDGAYLGDVDKILLHEGNYVILDKYLGKRVSVFDGEGRHIASMGKIGRGPKELMQLNDVWISGKGGIELYDFASKKIITYDSDYKYVKYRNGVDPVVFQSVVPLPASDGYVGFAGYSISNPLYEGSNYKLAFLSNDFGVKKTAFHYDPQLKGALVTTPTNPFVRVGDSIRFFQTFDNYIYTISPAKSISKRYTLRYQPKSLPEDFQSRIISDNLDLFKAELIDFEKVSELYKGFWGFSGRWLETGKYVIFDSFDQNYKGFISIYDKEQKEIVAQGRMFTDSDTWHLILPPASISAFEDNRFVSVFPGIFLQAFIRKSSPFYEIVNKNLDKNFVFEVKLK